jgi:hypothetical protein
MTITPEPVTIFATVFKNETIYQPVTATVTEKTTIYIPMAPSLTNTDALPPVTSIPTATVTATVTAAPNAALIPVVPEMPAPAPTATPDFFTTPAFIALFAIVMFVGCAAFILLFLYLWRRRVHRATERVQREVVYVQQEQVTPHPMGLAIPSYSTVCDDIAKEKLEKNMF